MIPRIEEDAMTGRKVLQDRPAPERPLAAFVGAAALTLALLLALAAPPARAQGADRLPKIATTGATPQSFVPADHAIAQRVDADFDGDGRKDVAMLIWPVCEGAEGYELESCRAEGRVLLIALRDPKGGYRLSLARELASFPGAHGDPFLGMKVRGSALSFQNGSISCAGAEGHDTTNFYGYRNGDWVRIGADEVRTIASFECGSGKRIADGDTCPGVKLRDDEICAELRQSTNYGTSMQESRWGIVRVSSDASGFDRVVVQRRRIPRVPPVRLADVELP
jgi:hypothetical protein